MLFSGFFAAFSSTLEGFGHGSAPRSRFETMFGQKCCLQASGSLLILTGSSNRLINPNRDTGVKTQEIRKRIFFARLRHMLRVLLEILPVQKSKERTSKKLN